ncbi:MAG TPA: TAXI family TRAP transporter solute-binding subunit [Longimicrobiales bacterium]|nr:TAXI family TRAP transporter solute-binding subunit [Longimicrobiales bacterium]
MRSLGKSGVVALLAVTTLSACGGGDGGGRRFLSLGTGGTGGVYYPLGGALASRLSLADSSRQYTAEVTGGSVENVNRIVAGQIDIGFVLSVAAYEAHNGGPDFPQPAKDLRIIAPLYANVSHIVVPGSSTAQSLADLRGKRVSVGSAGSGTEQISRQMLEIYGLTYDDIEPRYLSFTESSAALSDGAIDAAIMSVGIPAAAVLEASTTRGVRLLPMDAGKLAELRARYPYYSLGEIPVGAYPGVEKAVPAAAMMNWLVARADLDDDVVRAVLNILGPDRVSLERVHEMAKQIDLARLADAPIPLHAVTQAWVDGGSN